MNDAELNALRARVESLEQLQELLLYTATHDLRTPVMTILGFADLLLADWDNSNPPQSRSYLERIRSAAYRQSQMIQDLQRFTQLQREPLQPQMLKLHELVREQLEGLVSPGSNVRLNINTTPDIRCDAATMKIALNALLSNALKLSAGAQTPLVEFGVQTTTESNCFYVRSNGAGFDLGAEQTLPALFRRLQTGSEFSGTGIALLIATMIIHRHEGKLWVNTTQEHGPTVCFSLPA